MNGRRKEVEEETINPKEEIRKRRINGRMIITLMRWKREKKEKGEKD